MDMSEYFGGQPTPEQIRERLLEQQKSMTFAGTVYYEDGLEIKAVSGFIYATVEMATIFADYATPIREQGRTMIPMHRVVRILVDEPA
jgi:hypothetical protein